MEGAGRRGTLTVDASLRKSVVGDETNLVYFAPEFTETSTIKRVQQFMDFGWRPLVLGFHRGRYNCAYAPAWPHVLLGRTSDKRYWRRLFAHIAALPVLFEVRARLGAASVFYARNIDQLLLALFARLLFNPRAVMVYEILDVQPVFTGRGPVSRLLRWIERRCLSRIQLLVVSSPAFHRAYYAKVQDYRGPWFLLENKLHMSTPGPSPAPVRRETMRPWRVGYFGLIRGQTTLDLIGRIAPRLQGKVEFVFRGVRTTVDAQQFEDTLGRNTNIHYGGEYENPRDLAELYADVDFAWAVDLENIETNSRWLLPCRYYEAGLYGVPCLAKAGFEIGDLVARQGTGWAFADPLEETIVQFFRCLSAEEYRRTRANLTSLPRAAFVSGEDAGKLSAALGQHVRARSPDVSFHEPASVMTPQPVEPAIARPRPARPADFGGRVGY
jgi:succinoglycan biosynthesis protein ExoL